MVSTQTTTYITQLKSTINSCFTSNNIVIGDLSTPETITMYQDIADNVESLPALYLLTTSLSTSAKFPGFALCSSDFSTLATTIAGL